VNVRLFISVLFGQGQGKCRADLPYNTAPEKIHEVETLAKDVEKNETSYTRLVSLLHDLKAQWS